MEINTKTLGCIVLIIVALGFCFGATGVMAFTSPLTSPLVSPLPEKPEGLENCPYYAIERLSMSQFPTCNLQTVIDLKIDIHPKFISGCWAGSYTGPECEGMFDPVKPTPLPVMPKPTVEPTAAAPVWEGDEWEITTELWMNRCRMWTNGFRITRLECP